jgi:hypothetical protein
MAQSKKKSTQGRRKRAARSKTADDVGVQTGGGMQAEDHRADHSDPEVEEVLDLIDQAKGRRTTARARSSAQAREIEKHGPEKDEVRGLQEGVSKKKLNKSKSL